MSRKLFEAEEAKITALDKISQLEEDIMKEKEIHHSQLERFQNDLKDATNSKTKMEEKIEVRFY